MEALRASSLCSASPLLHQLPPRLCPPALLTRTLHFSGQHPTGLLYTKVSKTHSHLKNTQNQSKRHCDGSCRVRATARPVNDDQGPSTESVQAVEAAISNISLDVPRWMDAFYRFTRPHTVIGTVVGILSISLLAIQGFQDLSFRFSVGLLHALIPALFMNFYIVGLNQIFYIEIDKVNKSYFPLASGDFSLGTGISIVVVFAILSLGIGVYIGSRPLLWALSVSFILGTAYSVKLPWMRWKRSAFAAASCILSVRVIVVQLAFYMHMQRTSPTPAICSLVDAMLAQALAKESTTKVLHKDPPTPSMCSLVDAVLARVLAEESTTNVLRGLQCVQVQGEYWDRESDHIR